MQVKPSSNYQSRLKKFVSQHPVFKELSFSLKRLFRNPLTIIGLTIIIIFTFISIFAPLIAPPPNPHNPYEMPHTGWKTTPSLPSSEHIFGTLPQQYDIFYGVVWGARLAFLVGLLVTFINMTIGVILGSIAGYFGGLVDEIIMRIVDVFYAIPFIPLAMCLVVAIRKPGIGSVILVLIILGWTIFTRIIRSEVLVIRNSDYVTAARAAGASHLWIIVKHIIPNSIFSVLIVASMQIGNTIIIAATLSFLGLGSAHGIADWGQMVATCRNYIVGPSSNPLKYWFLVFIPGFVITLFVLGWNLLGDAVRDVFDPKIRRK